MMHRRSINLDRGINAGETTGWSLTSKSAPSEEEHTRGDGGAASSFTVLN